MLKIFIFVVLFVFLVHSDVLSIDLENQGTKIIVQLKNVNSDKFVMIWSSGTKIEGQFFEHTGEKYLNVFEIYSTEESKPGEADIELVENIRSAALDNGGFVVVWAYRRPSFAFYVKGRIINSNREKGNIFSMSDTSETEKCQNNPVVEARSNGFITSWESSHESTTGTIIYGRSFGNDGTPTLSTHYIASFYDNNRVQSSPEIVVLEHQSNYFHLYRQEVSPTSILDWNIYAQYSNIFGAITSTREFIIHEATGGNQYYHRSKLLKNISGKDRIVFVYSSHGIDGHNDGVFVKIGDVSGSQVTDLPFASGKVESQVNTHSYGDQTSPVICALENGGFVVAWHSVNQDNAKSRVYGQIYDSSYSKIENEFLISDNSGSDQDEAEFPEIECLPDNKFVVTWIEHYLPTGKAKLYSKCDPTTCQSNEVLEHLENYVDCKCVCIAGYYRTTQGNCEPCKIGSYKATKGDEKCNNCVYGTVTKNISEISETACVCDQGYGHFGSENGCMKCETNSYKELIGNLNCSQCGGDLITKGIGSSSYDSCFCGSGIRSGNSCISSASIGFAVIGISGTVILLIVIVIILVLLFLFLKTRKKANRFDHIEGVDMILKEVEIEQKENKNGPKFSVKKSNFIIDYNSIELVKLIGQGGSNSSVYLARWNGENVAFKGFNVNAFGSSSSTDRFAEFEREVQMCVQLSHPSILRFYGAIINPPKVGLLIEFCQNGDLCSFLDKKRISNKRNGYPIKEKLRILMEICSGMSYLHQKKIIHRDLKPENVLIDSSQKSKLMDFGLSKIKSSPETTMTRQIGTSLYMAPEVIKGSSYSFPCDVFSFANLAWFVIEENYEPYGKQLDQRIIMKNVSTNPNFHPKINQSKFKDCKFLVDIIKQNWNHDPRQRKSFKFIKNEIEKNIKKIDQQKRQTKKASPPIPKKKKHVPPPVPRKSLNIPRKNHAPPPVPRKSLHFPKKHVPPQPPRKFGRKMMKQ